MYNNESYLGEKRNIYKKDKLDLSKVYGSYK